MTLTEMHSITNINNKYNNIFTQLNDNNHQQHINNVLNIPHSTTNNSIEQHSTQQQTTNATNHIEHTPHNQSNIEQQTNNSIMNTTMNSTTP
jgi:hypothetical protein